MALPAGKPAIDFFTIVLPLGKTILLAGRFDKINNTSIDINDKII